MLYSILVVGLFEKPPPLMRRWKGFVEDSRLGDTRLKRRGETV
jgi:hypothetical protein